MNIQARGKRSGFLSRLKTEWKSMQLFSGENLCRLDWILSFLILAALFVTCVHSDVKLTGNRSFLIYEHLTDFYEASYEQSGGYYANYLPSTFIAYAIWNLPLYLSGHLPEAILTNSFVNIMWYKLLPTILYFATAQLIFCIGKAMGFGEKKALLAKFAFLVFPMGVFSQFIFGQYDVFTVFFMVWGLYMFLKGRMWKFALLFGIACTFKYHAAVYFLALLVLREKKIRHILKYGAIMALPLLIEIVPNLGSEAFRRNVFDFGALDYVRKPFTLGFFNGMNLLAAVMAFVLVWAYQKKVCEEEETASWAIFFCVAVSFALFGFSSWNPQWVMMMAPFLVLNIFINENGNMLLMATNIFMLALYIFGSQSMVDERVLNGGVLKYLLKGRDFAVRMWDLYGFHDEEMLCSAMWVVLLVYVVFGHPRYHKNKGTRIARGLTWQIRAAFLFGVGSFAVPMSVCAAGVLQGKIVFFDNSLQDMELDNVALLDREEPIVQEFTADGNTLSSIKVRTYVDGSPDEYQLNVIIREKDTGEIVYEKQDSTYGIDSNTELYKLLSGHVEVEKGKVYELEITTDAPEGTELGFYCVTPSKKSTEILEEPADPGASGEERRTLQMRITGEE